MIIPRIQHQYKLERLDTLMVIDWIDADGTRWAMTKLLERDLGVPAEKASALSQFLRDILNETHRISSQTRVSNDRRAKVDAPEDSTQTDSS